MSPNICRILPVLSASPSDTPLIVTPVANSAFDERPAFGLESLFENFERPKFKQSIEDGHSGQEEDYNGIIKPSSVRSLLDRIWKCGN